MNIYEAFNWINAAEYTAHGYIIFNQDSPEGKLKGEALKTIFEAAKNGQLVSLEVFEQVGTALLPHPGDFVQNRGLHMARLENQVLLGLQKPVDHIHGNDQNGTEVKQKGHRRENGAAQISLFRQHLKGQQQEGHGDPLAHHVQGGIVE